MRVGSILRWEMATMRSSGDVRRYERADSVVFRKTREEWGGLSNMASGYPILIRDILVPSTEALYQALRFPHMPEVQERIIQQNSAMAAKMVGKPFRAQSRPDWDRVRVGVMRWCLRAKLLHNWDEFGGLLLSTGQRDIVEDSHKDSYWGAIAEDDTTLVGHNVLGRLLMELREQLVERPDTLSELAPPQIQNCLFLGNTLPAIERASRTVPSGQPTLDLAWDDTWLSPGEESK